MSSSAVSRVSGARCRCAQRCRVTESGPDNAALTAAASTDASYARKIPTKVSRSMSGWGMRHGVTELMTSREGEGEGEGEGSG